jgi:hypothetical protein
MAIFAGIASLLGRFAGQILNTTLGWATLLLFGKVPQSRQSLLLVIVFGSLAWIVLVIGVLIPFVGTVLLTGAGIPAFVDVNWVRLGMLIGAVALPAVIGFLAMTVAEKGSRPTGLGLVKGVLRGYPFAVVLDIVLVVIAGVALVRRLRAMSKRWQDTHVPVVVKPGRYDEVLRQLSSTLAEAGLENEPRDAGRVISGPPKLLDLVAGRALGTLVPDRLMLLVGPDLEVLVYPSDVAISGSGPRVARARAAISTQLTHAPAYMTTSAEAQRFEDELGKQKSPRELRRLDERLARLLVPYDEWDILYRERLQVEMAMLQREPLGDDSRAAARPAKSERGLLPRPADLAIAGAGLGLIALDAALILTNRGGRSSRR